MQCMVYGGYYELQIKGSCKLVWVYHIRQCNVVGLYFISLLLEDWCEEKFSCPLPIPESGTPCIVELAMNLREEFTNMELAHFHDIATNINYFMFIVSAYY